MRFIFSILMLLMTGWNCLGAFNNFTNNAWATGTYSSGDTNLLWGTNNLPVQVTAPSTWIFQPNAKAIAGAWTNGAFIVQGVDHVTIDGGQNGIIACTNNGTLLGIQSGAVGVQGQGASFLKVINLQFQNMYVRRSTNEENQFGQGVIASSAFSPFFFHDFTVSNIVVTEAYQGVSMDYGAGAYNYSVFHSSFTNINWGIGCGDTSSSSTLTNVHFGYINAFQFSNWDDVSSGNANHHNGIFIFEANGGHVTNVFEYGLRIGGPWGARATAGVYVSNNFGGIYNWYCYNSIFYSISSDPNDGYVTCSAFNPIIFDNTFIGTVNFGTAINAGTVNTTWKNFNNLVYNDQIIDLITFFNGPPNQGWVQDFTLAFGYGAGGASPYNASSSGSAGGISIADWQAGGNDPHSIYGIDPLINGDGTLLIGSPALGAGTNLTAMAIALNLPDATLDINGNQRPPTGAWTIGAFQWTNSFSVFVIQGGTMSGKVFFNR